MFSAIMEIFALIAHLLSTSVRVAGPGGVRAVIAESLLLKHQLIVLNRARKRAPRLTRWDRLLFGIGAFWVAPNRLPKIAIGIRPFDAAALSPRADPAEIPTPIHAPSPSATRAQRALEATHRGDPRNAAPQSAIRVSANCPGDYSRVWRRDRQRCRVPHPHSAFPISRRKCGTLLAHVHRRHEGQPVERRSVPM